MMCDQAGDDDAADDPFSKYSGGFEGSFANTSAYFSGLVQLVGEPDKNVNEAVRAEHCDVPANEFGASDDVASHLS